MDTLHILQLDFVNVLIPAHYLVVWSRLGQYDRERLQAFLYGNGTYTEHWAHEASIVPARYWPLLAYRRERHQPWMSSSLKTLDSREQYLDDVLTRIEREGPLSVRDFESDKPARRRPGDWHRSLARHALEEHFGFGRLSVRHRLRGFERVYDLPSRVLPDSHDQKPLAAEDAHRLLLKDAASALGVATRRDLTDYFRMTAREAASALAELVEEGVLSEVAVEGWREPGYLSADARLPRRVEGACLLSPFDPLTWCRPRLERLFGFHYRLEIYVPESRRQWGYYVLPFRLGDRIVGRLDLKAERKAGSLNVRRVYVEDHADAPEVAASMAAELRELATWLGLARVDVERRDKFSRMLKQATASFR